MDRNTSIGATEIKIAAGITAPKSGPLKMVIDYIVSGSAILELYNL